MAAAVVEFRLLGPIQVVEDDRTLTLPGGRPLRLLAALLLHPNEVVSADRLIDDLWRERPPASAAKVLQVQVSELRKVLPAGVLATRPPGYVLRVEPDGLDAARAERLLAEARGQLAGNAPDAALATLERALALWRGPPLADVGFEPFAQAEVARLEELRLAVVEERAEVRLRLGRHDEVVGELETLVREHPTRERLRELLMLALYRAGRQAQALHVYDDARRTLAEELGLEPGPSLRRLADAVLRQDPTLELPSSGGARGSALVTVMWAEVEPAAGLSGGRAATAARRIVELGTPLRELVRAHRGREIEGMAAAIAAAFPSVRDAIACAAAVQRSLLADAQLGARIALALGETGPTEPHPLGAALAASRVARRAAPGELLVTEAVRHLAGDDAGVSFRDRGRVAVEGFPERWRLYEGRWSDGPEGGRDA